MKNLLSPLLRALIAVVVGILLIKYHEETLRWITILTGVMFFLSGVVSVANYYACRKPDEGISVYDNDGKKISLNRPVFPIVGIGSIVLGAILALMPVSFITGLTYIFALILILASVNQLVTLAHIRQIAQIGLFYWVAPSLILLVGLTALIRPEWIASAPLVVIGWGMVVYGVSEIINTLKANAARRAYKRMVEANQIDETTDTSEDVE